VKGIGAKTAQRIIVDLKDKIKMTDSQGSMQLHTKADVSGTGHEAIAALVMLGFPQVASTKVVSAFSKNHRLFRWKQSLRRLSKGCNCVISEKCALLSQAPFVNR
jgi:Holliday junction resolvasome RuvABC DNA-binding subunit